MEHYFMLYHSSNHSGHLATITQRAKRPSLDRLFRMGGVKVAYNKKRFEQLQTHPDNDEVWLATRQTQKSTRVPLPILRVQTYQYDHGADERVRI